MTKPKKEDIPKTFKGVFLNLFFYRTKEMFGIIIAFLIVIIIGLILLQSVSMGYKDGKFYFNWDKAADLKIEIKK
jgi:hypothetical protein